MFEIFKVNEHKVWQTKLWVETNLSAYKMLRGTVVIWTEWNSVVEEIQREVGYNGKDE